MTRQLWSCCLVCIYQRSVNPGLLLPHKQKPGSIGEKVEKTFVRGRRKVWEQPEEADAIAQLKQIYFFRILPDSLLPPFVSPTFWYQDNPICTFHIVVKCSSGNSILLLVQIHLEPDLATHWFNLLPGTGEQQKVRLNLAFLCPEYLIQLGERTRSYTLGSDN